MPAGGDGRFPQIAGFRFTYDANGVAQVTENDGTVTTPGTKVQEVVLDDGTVIVQGGQVVAGAPDVDMATNDFSARGGDQYPFRGLPFTTLGVTYQQALQNYIEDPTWGLGGTISAADYPEGGEGRITRIN
jgi:5'-nucleotidase